MVISIAAKKPYAGQITSLGIIPNFSIYYLAFGANFLLICSGGSGACLPDIDGDRIAAIVARTFDAAWVERDRRAAIEKQERAREAKRNEFDKKFQDGTCNI